MSDIVKPAFVDEPAQAVGADDFEAVTRSGVRLADVGGMDAVKKQLELSLLGPLRNPELMKAYKMSARGGLLRGAYHFFRHCKPGKAQAAHFIARVPKDVFALPPAIDVEDMRECSGASFDPVVKISDFLDAVEAYFGCRPLIYTTPQYEQAYLSGALSRERFWLRSIHLPPAYRRSDWVFWQYHHMGRRPGISGPVDLNAYRGTAADFERFVHSESCGGRKA